MLFFGTLPISETLGIKVAEIAFLNRMAITFVIIVVTLTIMTILNPLKEPKVMPVREEFDMKPTKSVTWLGAIVVVTTLVLYVIFW